MEFPLRFALVVLTTWVAAAAAGGVIAIALWRVWPRRRWPRSAVARASSIATIRLLPAVISAAAVALALPAFFVYEPRGPEDTSWLVIAMGTAGGLMVGATSVRLAAALRHAANLRRAWLAAGDRVTLPGHRAGAVIVDVPFPLVALLGIVRPELFLSRRVLDGCAPEQLTAMLDHERVHHRRRDNLTRLCMYVLVDPLACTRVAGEMAAAWHDASEQAADDGARDRLALAEGLLRVARLTTSPGPHAVAASTLMHATGVEARVRRLVASVASTDCNRTLPVGWVAIALAALLSLGAASDPVLRGTHALLELAVAAGR